MWTSFTFLFRLIFDEPDKTAVTYLCIAFGTISIISTAIIPLIFKKDKK